MKTFKQLRLLTLLLVVGIPLPLLAQVEVKAIVVRNIIGHNIGDTIQVLGNVYDNFNTLTRVTIHGQDGYRNIAPDRVEILDDHLTFWQKVWFDRRASELNRNGWNRAERQLLAEEAADYYKQVHQNKLIFENELLYDYLYQLIHLIHPEPLIRQQETHFRVVVIKSTEQEIFAFNDGMIVMSTGLLASFTEPQQLVDALVVQIAHVVLEHNLSNLISELRSERRAQMWAGFATITTAAAGVYGSVQHNNYYDPYLAIDAGNAAYFISKSFQANVGASYTANQNLNALNARKKYLQNQSESDRLNKDQFRAYMAPAVTFTAWQAYHQKNYTLSKELCHYLVENGFASEYDYLLFSKIIRATSFSDEDNQRALSYLQSALALNAGLIDLDKEAGLIYLRLNDKKKAVQAFDRYKDGVNELVKEGFDLQAELNFVNQTIQYHKLQVYRGM